MPDVLVDFIISLDGYASAEGWPGFWGLEGPEYLSWLDESPERDYTVLMGATTYRLMSGFASREEGMAALTAMPKVVSATTPEERLGRPMVRSPGVAPALGRRTAKAGDTPGLRTI